MKPALLLAVTATVSVMSSSVSAVETEWLGSISMEGRYFYQEPADPRQYEGENISLAVEPEFRASWNDGYDQFTFKPFGRVDQHDDERTHGDIRELSWIHASDAYELRLGISKVFWGVTESNHVVDIINQTDLVENNDGEDKLGQPMVNLALIRDWGTLDLFVLPGFRERTFPGERGRLRTIPRVDTNQAVYEARNGDNHVDLAARWSHYIGDYDFGLSWFKGTGRDPRLEPGLTAGGEPVLVPHYDLIEQVGLDIQATKGSWLWKLEAIHRSQDTFPSFNALTGGFEYTFFDIGSRGMDVGVLVEYLYDDRDTVVPPAFQDDVFLGTRIAWNDEQSTELLAGVIADVHDGTRLYNLEASRRIGQHWKADLEVRIVSSIDADNLLYSIRRDDHIQLTFSRFW